MGPPWPFNGAPSNLSSVREFSHFISFHFLPLSFMSCPTNKICKSCHACSQDDRRKITLCICTARLIYRHQNIASVQVHILFVLCFIIWRNCGRGHNKHLGHDTSVSLDDRHYLYTGRRPDYNAIFAWCQMYDATVLPFCPIVPPMNYGDILFCSHYRENHIRQ